MQPFSPSTSTNSNETEKNIGLAQEGLNSLKDTLDLLMKTAERAGKWGKQTATAALGLGGGLLVGVGIVTTLPVPNEWKPVVVGASGLAGAGGTVFVVIERDEKRKRIQEIQHFERLENSIDRNLKRARDYPELAPSLQLKLNYDLQTESILLRGDATGAIKVLPWDNDLPSNPEQNTLPPAQDNENPV